MISYETVLKGKKITELRILSPSPSYSPLLGTYVANNFHN